jgi:hypothetical protein
MEFFLDVNNCGNQQQLSFFLYVNSYDNQQQLTFPCISKAAAINNN